MNANDSAVAGPIAQRIAHAAQSASAHGLVGMRFRVEAESGSLTLRSAPGQGTLIRVTLPAAMPITA